MFGSYFLVVREHRTGLASNSRNVVGVRRYDQGMDGRRVSHLGATKSSSGDRRFHSGYRSKRSRGIGNCQYAHRRGKMHPLTLPALSAERPAIWAAQSHRQASQHDRRHRGRFWEKGPSSTRLPRGFFFFVETGWKLTTRTYCASSSRPTSGCPNPTPEVPPSKPLYGSETEAITSAPY